MMTNPLCLSEILFLRFKEKQTHNYVIYYVDFTEGCKQAVKDINVYAYIQTYASVFETLRK